MDYLLRDSLHTGVSYGRYDWQRLVHTVEAMPPSAEDMPRIGVTEGGLHAAEGLVIARYFMFTQVYFHKTRVIYDHHLQKALNRLLPRGTFTKPTRQGLDRYLEWDDWRVLGLIAAGEGGEHGNRLAHRNHYREIRHTAETPERGDLRNLERWRTSLGDLLAAECEADKSWYKLGQTDIPILSRQPGWSDVKPLSSHSSVVGSIQSIRQVRLYVRREDRDKAETCLN